MTFRHYIFSVFLSSNYTIIELVWELIVIITLPYMLLIFVEGEFVGHLAFPTLCLRSKNLYIVFWWTVKYFFFSLYIFRVLGGLRHEKLSKAFFSLEQILVASVSDDGVTAHFAFNLTSNIFNIDFLCWFYMVEKLRHL